MKARNELMDRAFIDVVFKPKVLKWHLVFCFLLNNIRYQSGIPGFQHREIELALKGAADQCIIATLVRQYYTLRRISLIFNIIQHPRTEISIIVQVLSEDGSVWILSSLHAIFVILIFLILWKLFATCLNAVTLALMDAGVPLLCVLAAVTVSVDGNHKSV